MADAAEIADYLDRLLRTNEVPDYPGAVNGLQLSGRGVVRRVAAAVDFSNVVARQAVQAQAQLLLVHHGMFWGAPHPITGWRYQALASLIENGIAVYSSHLPLDLHSQFGNNVLLARQLRLQPTEGFASYKNVFIGLSGVAEVRTSELEERTRAFSAEWGHALVSTTYDANRVTRKWGICTGAGADSNTLAEAVERGLDTIIVGEGPHHTAVLARDLDLVILYAGHYATETLGVRALAEHLSAQFDLECVFLAAPTGL